MKISILAIGKLRGAEAEWIAEYQKRLGIDLKIKELVTPKSLAETKIQKAEVALLLKEIPAKSFVVVLDERGKDMTSREFAAQLSHWQEQGKELVFIIGGASGLTDEVRSRAHFTLSFGRLTWPHRLVRVMLCEQIYRAKQINAGHPYHRD